MKDILPILLKAYAGYPIGWLESLIHQMNEVPTDLITMLCFHIVIDETYGKVASKYHQDQLPGNVITDYAAVYQYLNQHIGKDH